MKKDKVKLPAHSAGLPGKEISFVLCPLTPPIPPKRDGARSGHSISLHELDDHNLRLCVEAHGRAPGAGSAGGIH